MPAVSAPQLKKEGKLLSGKQKAEAERLAKMREQMLANANLPIPGAALASLRLEAVRADPPVSLKPAHAAKICTLQQGMRCPSRAAC
jgi:hypothetical protein